MSLMDRIIIINRDKISDSRGWFLKVIKGNEDYLPQQIGEVYVISADVGECRANHYHKQAHEWFTLIKGTANMIVEDIFTNEKITIKLNSEIPQTVYVPTNIAHAFNNIGAEPYILIAYSNLLYNSEDTISYKLCGK